MTTEHSHALPAGMEDFVPFAAQGFETYLGGLFMRQSAQGPAFLTRVKPEHCNPLHTAHGGYILALADIFLGATCTYHPEVQNKFVTVSLNHEFLGAARSGDWIHTQASLRKHGKSLMFVECEFRVAGELIGLSRAVMKKISLPQR